MSSTARAGDARRVSRRRSETWRRCKNEHQPDDEAGAADAGAPAEADGRLRVEATAGGGMVTVVVNGTKQLQSIKIDPEVVSKDDVEMLQDLIVAPSTTRTARSTSSSGSQMGGMLGGLKIPGLSDSACRGTPMPLSGSSSSSRSCPASAPRARSAWRFTSCARRARTPIALCDAIRDVKERVTYCSVCNNITDTDPVRVLHQRHARPAADLRRRGAAERRRHREDARVPRRLSRADGRAVAAAGRRPGRSEDQGPARASATAAWTK